MRSCRLFIILACLLGMAGTLSAEPGPATSIPARENRVRTVAILLFEGVELMDFAGPAATCRTSARRAVPG